MTAQPTNRRAATAKPATAKPAPGQSGLGRRSDLPVPEGELDAHLARSVRRSAVIRQGFYVVVLLVALAGQVSGAVETLHIPLAAAIPAVAALELGGIVVLGNADVRRRLGERAVASRLLSVLIAAAAVAFNWLAHADHLLGGFFAGMSALGYMVWLMHTENQRRDRLRVKGDLPPTTPAYEVVGHWLRHPWLTLRARAMAKADPRLGLYDSLAAARSEVRRERRQAAIAKVLHRKIRAAVDPNTADIAIAVYDLDEIATRLSDGADYDGLTALIAADLAPERLAQDLARSARSGARGAASRRSAVEPAPELGPELGRRMGAHAIAGDATENGAPRLGRGAARELTTRANGAAVNGAAVNGAGVNGVAVNRAGVNGVGVNGVAVNGAAMNGAASRGGGARGAGPGQPAEWADPAEPDRGSWPTGSQPTVPQQAKPGRGGTPQRPASTSVLPPALREDLARRLGRSGSTGRGAVEPAVVEPAPVEPAPVDSSVAESSLRRRVHAALDANVLPGDQRDDMELIGAIFDDLQLDEMERLSAATYVRSWRLEAEAGQRIRAR